MRESPTKLPDPELAAVAPRDPLTWLFAYRLILILILILMFSYPDHAPWLASSASNDPRHARLLLALQAQSVLIGGLFLMLRWPKREHQIEIAVFLDILLYTLLMHLSGGVSTGLGLILAMVVAAGALTMQGRLSLLFAAFATLAVIAQQVYTELYATSTTGTSTQAGLLGMTYFAVALLAHVLARRLRATEYLATRRQLDLADLSKLNDYIIQNMTMGVLVINAQRGILLLNHAARRLLNQPQLRIGEQLAAVAPALDDWLAQHTLDASRRKRTVLLLAEQELHISAHSLRDFHSSGVLLFLRDQRELIRQAQNIKLASLGRLTASIAHNIRNPLSAVTHASQLLAEAPGLVDDDLHLLDIIRRNARRIDETVTSVLELSRRDPSQPQVFDLNGWLTEFSSEYRACTAAAQQDCVHLELSPDRVMVAVDPRHFRQILSNLCDNAFKHGRRADHQAQVTLRVTRLADGDAVQLTVTDNGPGIAAAHLATLFDPFFTTSSSGTGLGLYAARELAQANGMELEYIAVPDAGAQFRLTFQSNQDN
ncbi:sensor histidine kinase [Thiospirillum jenense]|nr:ATP-binding protein [Thiospirillum jenense]